MKYNILFSITAHESIESLQLLIQNILYFNKNCGVIIHLSQSFQIEETILNKIKAIPHVYINPTRLYTMNYKILTPISSNMEYSMNIDYEYLCLSASNCFFYRYGAYDYIKQYDYGAYAFKMTDFTGKFKDCRNYSITIGGENLPHFYSGQHEGVFMKKELIPRLLKSFYDFCPLERMNNIMDTTEETILQTGINILFKDLKRGYPICLLRDRMRNESLGTDSSYDLNKTTSYLTYLINTPDAKIDYVLEEQEDNHFYTFKRVDRNRQSGLLDFILDLQKSAPI